MRFEVFNKSVLQGGTARLIQGEIAMAEGTTPDPDPCSWPDLGYASSSHTCLVVQALG